jgi:hypothetical protein
MSGSSSQTSLSFTISRVLYAKEYGLSWGLQSCNLSGATSAVQQRNVSLQSGQQSRQRWLPRPVNKQTQIHEPSYLGTLQWIKYSPATSPTQPNCPAHIFAINSQLLYNWGLTNYMQKHFLCLEWSRPVTHKTQDMLLSVRPCLILVTYLRSFPELSAWGPPSLRFCFKKRFISLNYFWVSLNIILSYSVLFGPLSFTKIMKLLAQIYNLSNFYK